MRCTRVRPNSNDPAAYTHYGRTVFQLRRFEEATTAYEKAMALGANDGGVLRGLGQAKFNQRQLEQAISFFSRAIEAGANKRRGF